LSCNDEDVDNQKQIEGIPQIKSYRLLVGSYDSSDLVEKTTFGSGEYMRLEFTAYDSMMDIEKNYLVDRLSLDMPGKAQDIVNTLPVQESIEQIYSFSIVPIFSGRWVHTFYVTDKQGNMSNKITFTFTKE